MYFYDKFVDVMNPYEIIMYFECELQKSVFNNGACPQGFNVSV